MGKDGVDASPGVPVWVCGYCGGPSVGLRWSCCHCGHGAGGASEGDIIEVPEGVLVVDDGEVVRDDLEGREDTRRSLSPM